MEPAAIDLSITLVPFERQSLEQTGRDPDQFLAIDFPIAALQPVSVGPKGAVFVAQFVVPDGTFEFLSKRNVVLGPDGKAPPPNMNELVGLPVMLRLVMKKTAFTAAAQDELQKSLQQQKFTAEFLMRSHERNSEPPPGT